MLGAGVSMSPEEHEMNILVSGFWEGLMTPSEKEQIRKIISSIDGRDRFLSTLNKRRGMNKINKKGFQLLGEMMIVFLDRTHEHFMQATEREKGEACR